MIDSLDIGRVRGLCGARYSLTEGASDYLGIEVGILDNGAHVHQEADVANSSQIPGMGNVDRQRSGFRLVGYCGASDDCEIHRTTSGFCTLTGKRKIVSTPRLQRSSKSTIS